MTTVHPARHFHVERNIRPLPTGHRSAEVMHGGDELRNEALRLPRPSFNSHVAYTTENP